MKISISEYEDRLIYRSPAREWNEALPTGNGRLGAMMFGGQEVERIQLNEDTLWSGYPKNFDNPQALNILPQVRKLLSERKYSEADSMCKQMMGPYTQSYMPFADLYFQFEHGALVKRYQRALDLRDGVSSVEYQVGNVTYKRSLFVSYPDQVVVLRLEASQPGMLNVQARLTSSLRHQTSFTGDKLILKGYAPEHVDPSYYDTDVPLVYGHPETTEAMRFEGQLSARIEGGSMECDSNGMHIAEASIITFVFSAGTSFNGYNRLPGSQGKDPGLEASVHLFQAMEQPYEELLQRHIGDHRRLFDRVELRLGDPLASKELSTDARIREFGAKDHGLVELLFHYGRYLMIASSRPGTQPANLQGIWNQETRPPWSSNWTLNINAEMNYWPAETCNLAECHSPLLELIGRLAKNGRQTASAHYGARGWVAHHNTDIWCLTSPVGHYGHGDPVWALWPMGGIWLCQHLWEHYAFGKNEVYLREQAYPIMKEAALFCMDWLCEDEDGRLISSPSTSPEHKFRTSEGVAGVSTASAMDMSLIWELFTNVKEASRILGVDKSFQEQISQMRDRLSPLRIGKHGRLQEWSEDFEDEDPHHRHVSHLFGVYPGRQITKKNTPELMAAAERSLEIRGDCGTGWSLGWKIGLWARFGQGNRAFDLLSNLLRLVDDEQENYHSGGVYANLFDAHPPFQIDGNFAATSGIAELLVQSHQDYIQLLPALPAAWPAGYVKGLRARGGFELTIHWENGRVTAAQITSVHGGRCRVLSTTPLRLTTGEYMSSEEPNSDRMLQFDTNPGEIYHLCI